VLHVTCCWSKVQRIPLDCQNIRKIVGCLVFFGFASHLLFLSFDVSEWMNDSSFFVSWKNRGKGGCVCLLWFLFCCEAYVSASSSSFHLHTVLKVKSVCVHIMCRGKFVWWIVLYWLTLTWSPGLVWFAFCWSADAFSYWYLLSWTK